MRAVLKKWALPVLAVIVTLAALYVGWDAWNINRLTAEMYTAPQGQSTGPANAGLVIVEFMDYRCTPCRRLHPVMQQVIKDHPDIRVIFRDMPVYVAPSVKEARIALAAGLQGKFMAMHDLLMTHEKPVEDVEIMQLCQQAGVDFSRLKDDITDPGINQTLLDTLRAAGPLHIKQDPTFLIGNTLYDTSNGMPTAADFDHLIAAARAKGAAR